MSDFTIFTRSSDRSKSLMFENTAKRFGIPIVIDTGNESFVDLECFSRQIRNLEQCTTPYVLLTDAFDVLMARWDEEEVIQRVIGARGNIIISGEPECWPKGPWQENYKEIDSIWPYACGGQMVGTTQATLSLSKEIYARRQEVTAGGGNQELLHILVGKDYPMEIDSRCNIFQCMRTRSAEWVFPVTVVGGKQLPYNFNWHTFPMFLHFNDLKNTPGMPEWYARLTQ